MKFYKELIPYYIAIALALFSIGYWVGVLLR